MICASSASITNIIGWSPVNGAGTNMKFDELDSRMRVFETAHDHCVLPGIHMVARLDGRNFTRLTRDTHLFEAPFDQVFRDYMLETVEHLMNCGIKMIYGFTESDEISLLMDRDVSAFGRKLRKLNSIIAGEASAKFSLLLGDTACFDCRISQLPTVSDVVDYFRWRNEDAHRNALNAHCYWSLRKEGRSARQATAELEGMSIAAKNELLFERGINFNDLPAWQKRGCGVYWEQYSKTGLNPLTGEKVPTERKRLRRDLELPMKDSYSHFVMELFETSY
jgi:tRNA(His) 5'-end guanylyltransferase